MISIENLTFTYGDGTFQLRIPQLTLEAGRAAVIVGPSGSGKTTLLNLIAGILPGTGGEITVGNTAVHRLRDSDRRLFRLLNVGQVFQFLRPPGGLAIGIDLRERTENVLSDA